MTSPDAASPRARDLCVDLCFFFHWNILYAEISPPERRELATRSYQPTLDLLDAHPAVAAVVEMNGATLEHLVRFHPGVLDKLKALVARGQVELAGSTWRSPFLLDVRESHFALHMRMYLRAHEDVFGSRPRGFYAHECCADERLPRLMHQLGYEWFFAWVRHVAKHLPVGERVGYIADRFIFPFAFTGDDGQRAPGLPLHGDEIDCLLSASDGTYDLDWYAERLGAFSKLCAGRPGILVPGPSDGEFVHNGRTTPRWFRRVFDKHRHIRPDWLDRLWTRLEADGRIRFTAPSTFLDANPPARTLKLLPGGGFERNDLEHSDKLAEPLHKQLRNLAAQVDLLQAKSRLSRAQGRKLGDLPEKIERHADKMLALELSDLSRWHPSAETRRNSVAAARDLLAQGRVIERELDAKGAPLPEGEVERRRQASTG